MPSNVFKVNAFLTAWKKYMPVIRILMKKSAVQPQVLSMNRMDFEKDAKRKLGYKFKISFHNSKTDTISAGSEIIESFIFAMMHDETTCALLVKANYSFALNSKYQLEISKFPSPQEGVTTEPAEEMLTQ